MTILSFLQDLRREYWAAQLSVTQWLSMEMESSGSFSPEQVPETRVPHCDRGTSISQLHGTHFLISQGKKKCYFNTVISGLNLHILWLARDQTRLPHSVFSGSKCCKLLSWARAHQSPSEPLEILVLTSLCMNKTSTQCTDYARVNRGPKRMWLSLQ